MRHKMSQKPAFFGSFWPWKAAKTLFPMLFWWYPKQLFSQPSGLISQPKHLAAQPKGINPQPKHLFINTGRVYINRGRVYINRGAVYKHRPTRRKWRQTAQLSQKNMKNCYIPTPMGLFRWRINYCGCSRAIIPTLSYTFLHQNGHFVVHLTRKRTLFLHEIPWTTHKFPWNHSKNTHNSPTERTHSFRKNGELAEWSEF